MNVWALGILIFIVDFVASFGWAEGINSIATKKPLKSGIWAGFLTLAGAFTLINYTSNNWFLIPGVSGSFLGAYLSVKFKKNEN